MCRMFAEQPQENYAYQTRSIRIGGHGTSVRLETVFWTILEEIAANEGRSVANFVTTLHDEVLAQHGELNNLASLLRCSCLLYKSGGARPAPVRAAAEFDRRRRSFTLEPCQASRQQAS